MLSLFLPNIEAGFFLVIILGLLGQHLVARNQALDVMLLGSEFQSGILVAALVMNIFEGEDHGDHGFHFETVISLLFVFILHPLLSRVMKSKRFLKVEASLVFILLLMGVNHLVVLLSPAVEFHMIKASLGDIVTASKAESYFVMAASILMIVLFMKNRQKFLQNTIDIALLNKPVKDTLFNGILFLVLVLSIHLFGTLFTLAGILLPSFLSSAFRLSRRNYMKMVFSNSLIVVASFLLITKFDRLPTTVVIVFLIFIYNLSFSLLLKRK